MVGAVGRPRPNTGGFPDSSATIVAMLRSRLTAKITLVITAVLIVGFGAATIWSIRIQSAVLLEQSKLAAKRQTETIVASIEGAMLQERPDVTRSVLQELKGASPVEGLTIYRANGTEAFTDLSTVTEVMKNAELSKEVLDNIRRRERKHPSYLLKLRLQLRDALTQTLA